MSDNDLIRRGDARDILSEEGWLGDSLERINALPAVTVGLPTDCRKWPFYPIQMPTTKDGKGPATIGVDAASVSYEVWDWEFNTYASFENLPDAINEAMRLSLAVLEPVAAPDPAAIREAANLILQDFDAILTIAGKVTEAANSGRSSTHGVRLGLNALIPKGANHE